MRIEAGTRAVVTGASRGIGRAVAEVLAGRGATVGLVARSGPELQALAEEMPGEHTVLACDISDRDAVSATLERYGDIDLLVVNAGIAHYGAFAGLDLDRAEEMTRINWLGTVYTVKAALPRLRRGSHIVIVSSAAALRTFPEAAVYGATKSAQRAFADALRHELAADGMEVTTVFPGEIATALHEHEKDTMPAWYRGGPDAVPAQDLAVALVEAVEKDERYLHYPRITRVMGVAHGVSPGIADRLLRRIRGTSAAPRR